MNKSSIKTPKRQKSEGKKKKYRVRNWKEYNQALVDRGKVLFWITEEAIRNWEEKNQKNKEKARKRGRPKTYSKTAIEAALTVQQIFHLTLRQTEGFLTDILAKLNPRLKSPDYSTLSIRGQTLPVIIPVRANRQEPLHIVIDSSGAKVYGEGEWKVRQHGWSKHRTWKKLHIGVDEANGDILIGEVTNNDTADGKMLKSLLGQLPKEVKINQVSNDGAYDKRNCYQVLQEYQVDQIAIPPQKNAKIWQHGNTRSERLPRDENLRQIRKVGRKQWKIDINYHRRSLVENTMFRFKTIFTDRVSARTEAGQRTQLLLRCRILNRMTMLGMPKSYLVA